MVKELAGMQRHYDFFPTEEDLMGGTSPHSARVHSLVEVLTWPFRQQVCAIHDNLNFYQSSDEQGRPLAPDSAVIKGRPFRPGGSRATGA